MSGSGRRPMGFFGPFNKWWSSFYLEHRRRPSKSDIEAWRSEHPSWRPELSLEDIVQHSKGRRDPEKNRAYFVEYRRKMKAAARKPSRKGGAGRRRAKSDDSEAEAEEEAEAEAEVEQQMERELARDDDEDEEEPAEAEPPTHISLCEAPAAESAPPPSPQPSQPLPSPQQPAAVEPEVKAEAPEPQAVGVEPSLAVVQSTRQDAPLEEALPEHQLEQVCVAVEEPEHLSLAPEDMKLTRRPRQPRRGRGRPPKALVLEQEEQAQSSTASPVTALAEPLPAPCASAPPCPAFLSDLAVLPSAPVEASTADAPSLSALPTGPLPGAELGLGLECLSSCPQLLPAGMSFDQTTLLAVSMGLSLQPSGLGLGLGLGGGMRSQELLPLLPPHAEGSGEVLAGSRLVPSPPPYTGLAAADPFAGPTQIARQRSRGPGLARLRSGSVETSGGGAARCASGGPWLTGESSLPGAGFAGSGWIQGWPTGCPFPAAVHGPAAGISSHDSLPHTALDAAVAGVRESLNRSWSSSDGGASGGGNGGSGSFMLPLGPPLLPPLSRSASPALAPQPAPVQLSASAPGGPAQALCCAGAMPHAPLLPLMSTGVPTSQPLAQPLVVQVTRAKRSHDAAWHLAATSPTAGPRGSHGSAVGVTVAAAGSSGSGGSVPSAAVADAACSDVTPRGNRSPSKRCRRLAPSSPAEPLATSGGLRAPPPPALDLDSSGWYPDWQQSSGPQAASHRTCTVGSAGNSPVPPAAAHVYMYHPQPHHFMSVDPYSPCVPLPAAQHTALPFGDHDLPGTYLATSAGAGVGMGPAPGAALSGNCAAAGACVSLDAAASDASAPLLGAGMDATSEAPDAGEADSSWLDSLLVDPHQAQPEGPAGGCAAADGAELVSWDPFGAAGAAATHDAFCLVTCA
ncbi:hypothetical protein HYH03_006802 [Edaphochlamys debaryana]|uniref:Uncharacterized protein n=1 Tax=Edaphochlamys debaryana TaxID=47281 RepID=A0A835Y3B9_9CHLO|nr:hypothetical protein HYH03_006802 [Edaphochlamys debaryana]|eukprot:KAG2495196.1 hypothetical protein HYH03_006802 [Edaphochlamys debaryana]